MSVGQLSVAGRPGSAEQKSGVPQPATAGQPGAAEQLSIAGLVPLSTVDWPGRLAATVFLQGCPWACLYCHNELLIDTKTPGQISWKEVQDFLSRRVGLLDGVVFTGGEACRQSKALTQAAREVKAAGFQVGLHTAGAFPNVVRSLLEQNLVDWVGLDIKALPADYGTVIQRAGGAGVKAGQKAWETLDVLVASGVEHEVRLTTFPAFFRTEIEIAQQVAKAGAKVFALQQARPQGTPTLFAKALEAVGEAQWDHQFAQIAQQVESTCGDMFDEFIVRD